MRFRIETYQSKSAVNAAAAIAATIMEPAVEPCAAEGGFPVVVGVTTVTVPVGVEVPVGTIVKVAVEGHSLMPSNTSSAACLHHPASSWSQ